MTVAATGWRRAALGAFRARNGCRDAPREEPQDTRRQGAVRQNGLRNAWPSIRWPRWIPPAPLATRRLTLDCSLIPTDAQYAILLRIPGEVGKGVLLPRRMLERALNDPTARARVRNLLRASVEVLRSQRAITEARLTAYFTALNVRSLPGPRCAHCEGPLLADDAVVIHHGSRRHLACPPAW
jgi:hypothetical protein